MLKKLLLGVSLVFAVGVSPLVQPANALDGFFLRIGNQCFMVVGNSNWIPIPCPREVPEDS